MVDILKAETQDEIKEYKRKIRERLSKHTDNDGNLDFKTVLKEINGY